jgi:hypothetical protein
MTASLMPQHEAATGEPSLFDSLSRLVPSELQREYYRVLAHTRSLNPEDEMLKILEAMGILALITRHTPADIAAERERIQEMLDIHLQFAGEAQQRMLEYNQLLEGRLAALPSEVEDGLNPEKISKLLGEGIRQRLAETGIEDAANALQQTASALSSAQKRLAATFVNISDPRIGIAAQVEDSNKKLDILLQERVRKLDHLLHNFKSDVLKIWLPLAACGAFLLGISAGVSLERWNTARTDAQVVTPAASSIPAPQSAMEEHPLKQHPRAAFSTKSDQNSGHGPK